MREENVAKKISQLPQLFLPQQYNLLQFASFFPAIYTLRVLIDVPPLTNFFTSFTRPTPAPYSNTPRPLPPPPTTQCLLFFRISSNQKKIFIHIDWYTCKILSNLVNFPYFNSCLGYFFTNFSYVAQIPPYPFFLPIYQIFCSFWILVKKCCWVSLKSF